MKLNEYDIDDEQLNLWSERLREDNRIWNRGFRWGCFWTFLISVSSVMLVGHFIAP